MSGSRCPHLATRLPDTRNLTPETYIYDITYQRACCPLGANFSEGSLGKSLGGIPNPLINTATADEGLLDPDIFYLALVDGQRIFGQYHHIGQLADF